MDQQTRWLPPAPHPVTEPHPPAGPPARERRSLLGRLLMPLVLAGVLALKWGAKLKGLLLVLPKLKLLTTRAVGDALPSERASQTTVGRRVLESTTASLR